MATTVKVSPLGFTRRMGRTYSNGSECSSAFSDCPSDRSVEFPLPGSPSAGGGASSLHRLLVSSSASEFSDDAVLRLVSDLESPSVDSQLRAAMELRLLAKDSTENRLRIARAGAVAPLVALLAHPDPQLQEHGVTAILNLSLCDENKAPIAAAGAVHHLIGALRDGTPSARENAACAILRLAQLDDLRPAIVGAGAIPPLVALLEHGGPRGKKDAATALYELLAAKDNGPRTVEAGVVRPLLDLMADPESGMVDKSACVLRRVLAAPEGRAVAVDNGAVPVLVEMLELGSRRQKEIAMLSLLEICEKSSSYRRLVVHEGAIPPLVALSQSSSKKKEKAEALVELLRRSPRTR